MSNGSLKVYKQLAAKQDLALGKGKVTQNRNGNNILVDKFNPVEAMLLVEAQADKTAYDGKVVVISDRANCLFEFKTGQTPNGYDIVQSTAILTLSLELREGCRNILAAIGAVKGQNCSEYLAYALKNYVDVTVNSDYIITPTLSEAKDIVENLNNARFTQENTLFLPDGVINFSSRVLLDSPSLVNLNIAGVDTDKIQCTSSTVTGSDKNYSLTFTSSSTSDIDVGDYAIVSDAVGSEYCDVVRGCWLVTGKTSNSITVKHTLNNTFPTFTTTSVNVWPIKSILKWPVGVVGLAITTTVKQIKNCILSGSYDISTGVASDGPADGLQVGSSPNTPETGFNESQQSNVGSLYAARVGIVEWENNGTQILGKLYGVLLAVCSNGWRGLQAARGGFIGAKGSACSGNGASGYEAEENGFILASGSVAAGNWQQGYFTIGDGSISCGGSVSVSNLFHGIEAKNGSNILADSTKTAFNTLFGVTTTSGYVLFGSNAKSESNGVNDIDINEGGTVNATGASSLGSVQLDNSSGSLLIQPSGEAELVSIYELQSTGASNGRMAMSLSSITDLNFAFDPSNTGTYTGAVRMKNSGTLHPIFDNVSSLGRPAERWSVVFAAKDVINTSDAREKTKVSKLSDDELNASKQLAKEIGSYQWLASIESKGDKARKHIGLTVQRAIEIMEDNNLDAFSYGFICFDEWESEEEQYDDEGNVISPSVEAGDRYGFRYSQLAMFIQAGLNQRLDMLESK